jgi:amino acid transporter
VLSGGIVAPAVLATLVLSAFWAKLVIFITVLGQFFCGMACVTANSRMIYAFSRDGGLPGSKLWHRINPRTRTPTNSLWLAVVLSALLGAISLIQHGTVPVAFFALTGIAVVGLYISYVIPVYLRLRNPDFEQNEWNLGKYSKLVGWTSVVWVGFITVLFFAPLSPDWKWWDSNDIDTANYAGPVVLGVMILVGIWWATSAKNHFTGPKVQGTREELLAIEHELEALEG